MKRQKIELQLECLKVKNCKMALERMDLEQKLGVTPLEITYQYNPNQSQVLIFYSDNIIIRNPYTST
jgi:hypothetical protein